MERSYPFNTRRLAKAVGVLLCSAMTSTAEAEGPRNFDIAPQALGAALNRFSEIVDMQLSYPAELAEGVSSPGVSGAYTPEQALEKLLDGSGLKPRVTGNETITIERSGVSLSTDYLLAQAPKENYPVKAADNSSYTGPVEQEDLMVSGAEWSAYAIPNATAGTKTDTPIMETPLNIQVIPEQVLKDQQIIHLSDALKNVSGVTSGAELDTPGFGGSRQTITVRGFASEVFFRNGFRIQQGAAMREMANIENIEILKGSAAILYGLVEPGGMVNVTTKQPLAMPYYALQQQFGSYDLYRTTIDATGPLTEDDTLLYRMNISYENSGSFREFVDNEKVFVAPVLKWNISDDTQATLELEYSHGKLGLDSQFVPTFNKQFIKIPRSRNYGEPAQATNDSIYVGFNWSHRFNDNWSIKYNFSMSQQETERTMMLPRRADGGQVPRLLRVNDSTIDSYSTSLDLTGHFETFGVKHTLLLGGDYYRDETFYKGRVSPRGSFSYIDVHNPVHPGNPYPLVIDPNRGFDSPTLTDQYGLYLQDQIELPYNFHFTGGFRYQYIHQKANNFGEQSPTLTADEVTPRVGLLWQPQSWLSLYSNYTESFGAGAGLGHFFSNLVYPGTVIPPTTAQQWEVGTKVELFDGRLRATFAYYDLTKQNVATPDPVDHGDGGFYSIVAGEVRSRGYELDIQGEILPGWNVIATYSNTDARVTKSEDLDTPYGKEGSRFYNVPRNTASVWSTYDFQQAALQGLKIGGGVVLRDNQLACCSLSKIPGYATVDLLAAYSWKVGKTMVTAQLNVNNLLDKYYYSSAYFPAENLRSEYDGGYVNFGKPRSFMGSIKVEF